MNEADDDVAMTLRTSRDSPVTRSARAVASWLTGYATSLVGDQMFYVILSWAAVQVASPGVVGLILVANAVPRAVLVTLGGSLVDRLGPKRLIISSDSARVVTMLAMGAVALAGPPDAATLVVLAVLFGVVDGFFLPAVSAAPPYLAPMTAMTRVQALKTVVSRLAMFVGPPLASFLIVAGGVSGAAWAVAALFAVSVAALLTTPMARRVTTGDDEPGVTPEPAGWWREFTGGFRVLGTHRTIGLVVAMIAVVELGFSGPMTAGPALLASAHDWGVTGVGVLLGGFGGGAALAALVLAVRGKPAHVGYAVLVGLGCIGVGVCAIGVLTHLQLPATSELTLAGAAAVLAGAGSGVFGTLLNATLLTLAPIAHLGRVMAVVTLAAEAVMPLSLAATGWVTMWTSADVPFMAGGALIVVTALGALTSRRIRGLELDADGRQRREV